MIRLELFDDAGSARERVGEAWDALAVELGLPLCAPGWMLSWWHTLAPPGAALRVLAAYDGERLLGLAPWYLQPGERRDLRPLGAEYSDRVDLLASRGEERRVAQALAGALCDLDPAPDLISFEAVPIGSPWARLLSAGVHGRMRFSPYRNSALPAPAVALEPGPPGAWLGSRSSNFRSQMRRMRRHLERRGGAVRRVSETSEMGSAIDAMLALHRARWEGRGESKLTDPAVARLLREAAAALGPERLRMWVAEIQGEPISAQLFLAAGSELKYWNGGWSEQHADLKPSMLTILAALEDAIARGERRLDLGVGEHPYKLRFADSSDTLTWGGLIVRNRRWLRTRAELTPRIARYRAKRLVQRMPEGLRARIEIAVRGRRKAG